jgi:hypothetical protein
MNNPSVPPVSEGTKALYEAFVDAYDETAQQYHLKPSEIMVALGAVTGMIIHIAAMTNGLNGQKMLDDYKASLKLFPSAPQEDNKP